MSELKYNEPAERFGPIVEKSLCAGATAVMIPSETGSWVHYAEYCERIAAVKSEADKVIAEKDEKIDIYKRGFEESDKINAHLYAELRHANYKRCLAMAKLCHERSLWWYSKGYGFEKYDKFWEKWEKRWLELADKFKEAK